MAQFTQGFLSRYLLVRRIGSGTSGEVHEAIQVALDRRVAVKVLKVENFHDAENRARFVEEAKLLSRISHGNIVALLDADTDGDRPYIVMEYVEGSTLEARIRAGLPMTEALDIARGLLAGLHALHSAGIIHRDLKPENVLLAPGLGPKLADFGLARVTGSRHLTAEGYSVGTPMYMAPELVFGEDATARSDIYAFGVTLYHMLTGGFPVPLGDSQGALQRKLELDRAALAASLPAFPESVVDLLARCLDPMPANRPASAAEVAAALPARPAARAPAPPRERSLLPHAFAAAGAAALVAAMAMRPADPVAAARVTPAAQVERPTIRRVTTGTRRARLLLSGPKAGAVEYRRAGDSNVLHRALPATATEATLDGLTPGSVYVCSAGGSAPVTFATLQEDADTGAALLARGPCLAEKLEVAVRGARIAALWRGSVRATAGREVTIRESDDAGRTWGEPEVLSAGEPIGQPLYLQWLPRGLLAAWLVDRQPAIIAQRFRPTDSMEWTTPSTLSVRPPGGSLYVEESGAAWLLAARDPSGMLFRWNGHPAFVLPGVHSLHPLRVDGRPAVVALVSEEDGARGQFHFSALGMPPKWTQPKPLPVGDDRPGHPSVAVSGRTVAVAYETNETIALLVSSDGGATFRRAGPVLPESVLAKRPQLLGGADGFLLACYGYGIGGVAGRKNLMLARSTDGVTWSAFARLPFWMFESRGLRAATSGGRLLLFPVDHIRGVMALEAKP